MRVVATPLLSKMASSRRWTIVSAPPSSPGVPVARGWPRSTTRPEKASELAQKKPFGMGFVSNFTNVVPSPGVRHTSIPFWTVWIGAAAIGRATRNARAKVQTNALLIYIPPEVVPVRFETVARARRSAAEGHAAAATDPIARRLTAGTRRHLPDHESFR